MKLALVVDDSAMQCKILSILLAEEGYRAIIANDGLTAVTMYVDQKPDLVLMDINMPIMNGYEAARKIKSISRDSLCPLIFITSMNTDEAFVESIEAGGDGILVRPFSPAVFKAKIKSIQRISNLYGEVKKLQHTQHQDAQLAEKLFSDVIESKNFGLDKIGILKKPATLFSGDVQLTALSPNGNVNVMLGDFTGHGLRSSIGAIPLAEIFRAMTSKGFSLLEIAAQINRQLYSLLPADLFLAVAFVSVSSQDSTVYIFNAGLPDVYLFNNAGDIKKKIPSTHIPLGIQSQLLDDVTLEVLPFEKPDHVILISDGILEARNESGEMFASERFESAARDGLQKGSICKSLDKAIDDFCQNMEQEDDISLIDLPCGDWDHLYEFSVPDHEKGEASTQFNRLTNPSWSWSLKLTGSRLVSINPIPMAISQIKVIEEDAKHLQCVFTILTELYVNSLDHGILELDSELKKNSTGFLEYFSEREQRLKKLSDGFINISINYYPVENGGKLVIDIEDSGKGFNYEEITRASNCTSEKQNELKGRGVKLVKHLCEQLSYDKNGTAVKAVYSWFK